MNYNNPEAQRISRWVRIVCDSLFVVFAFLFLWKIHGGVLAMTQHVLSHGQTVYNEVIGAFIITLILFILKVILNRIFNLEREWYMLSYFPSMMLLGVLCNIDGSAYEEFGYGNWLWQLPVFFAAYVAFVIFVKHLSSSIDERGGGNIIRLLVPNMLIMSLMTAFCLGIADNDEVIINQERMEDAFIEGDLDRLLSIGSWSRRASREMTALRAYALSKRGKLGDSLFCYPQPYGSSGLMLEMTDTVHMRTGVDSIFYNFGAYPRKGQDIRDFLFMLDLSYTQKRESFKDIRLCAYLLDRNLKGFVKELERTGDINDSIPLPRFYSQALVLYKNRIYPFYEYVDEVNDSIYSKYMETVRKYSDRTISMGMASKDFYDTYYLYYDNVK